MGQSYSLGSTCGLCKLLYVLFIFQMLSVYCRMENHLVYTSAKNKGMYEVPSFQMAARTVWDCIASLWEIYYTVSASKGWTETKRSEQRPYCDGSIRKSCDECRKSMIAIVDPWHITYHSRTLEPIRAYQDKCMKPTILYAFWAEHNNVSKHLCT